ncbi:FecCD family ABC transporter permease [Paenibacillus sp. Leaf72]|uniref:FecCD family ABC transporter permease n=1 Tax=Paenibacillus sp. Leaf72 TaxID=1736234 RepID=UPI0006F3B69E|nr:iron ABC transporter permease [Paenibacillus sp. Leaf72]KQO17997.1 iron ABC transporter permease [Paenibacillus sp. Leaf72]
MSTVTLISKSEQRRTRRAIIVMTIMGVLIITAFVISMNTGFIKLTPLDVFKTLFGYGTAKQELILFDFRLPRIVISVLIGAGFAVSGCVMQGLFRNPLADPGLLGINAGAGLMVILYISFFRDNQMASPFFMPMLAFGGAALTALLIYTLSYKRYHGLLPTRMILVGVAVQAGISALMIVLSLALDPNDYQLVQVWLVGNIYGTNWKFVLAALPWILLLIPYVMYKSRTMNVLNLGEQMATGLGSPVEKDRMKLLAAAVGLAATCVAVGGGISFVGLIGPHLARRLVGPTHQILVPASALAGALLVIVSDTLARWAFQPSEIPTGIVIAVIGAPYFLYLLSRSK